MGKFIDLTGKKFGRLTVLERLPNETNNAKWRCKCECGNFVEVLALNIRSGNTKSCGCLSATHRMTHTSTYKEWENMKSRCYIKSSSRYERYGARGITVCDRWRDSFEAFYEDVSMLPHFGEKGYSLDRINTNGNYEPSNVRWADRITQANNTSTNHFETYNGKTQTIAQWAREYNINSTTLRCRLKAGWSMEKALTKKGRRAQ